MNPFDIFSSGHPLRVTNSVLDIESRVPHVDSSPSFRHSSWLMRGRCGGRGLATTWPTKGKNSWVYFGTIPSRSRSGWSFASLALSISMGDALNTICFPFVSVRKNEDLLSITIFPRNDRCRCICCSDMPSFWGQTGSGGSFVTHWMVRGISWERVVQYCDPNVSVFDANRTTLSWSCKQGHPTSIGYCPSFVTDISNWSLRSWIIIPTLAICEISPDSVDLPSIASTCRFSFISWSVIWWWGAKSWSINAMPVAPQSISACVGISWSFTVNVQVLTECFPSIDPANTSTLLSDKHEIPKHF